MRPLTDAQQEAYEDWRDMPVHYPFPLRHGRATIILPRIITREDAERLVTFIRSLPVNERLGPGA